MTRIFLWISLFSLFAGVAGAATHDYSLSFPAGELVSNKIEFEVSHPGRLRIEAQWEGARVVSFRLNGPGDGGSIFRLSGPSPQQLELDVDAKAAADRRPWTLSIRSLPSRAGSRGTLQLILPDPAGDPVVALEPEPGPPVPPEEYWRVPGTTPTRTVPAQARFHAKVESFRTVVVGEDYLIRDKYLWQDGLLKFLVDRRDASDDGGTLPLPESTRAYLERVVEAVAKIDSLRTTDDPILTGRRPKDPDQRRRWHRERRHRLAPLESELDVLLEDLRTGHAPELERAEWTRRLVSCLIACQRYFSRVGDDAEGYRAVGETQWKPVVAGSRAIEALLAQP